MERHAANSRTNMIAGGMNLPWESSLGSFNLGRQVVLIDGLSTPGCSAHVPGHVRGNRGGRAEHSRLKIVRVPAEPFSGQVLVPRQVGGDVRPRATTVYKSSYLDLVPLHPNFASDSDRLGYVRSWSFPKSVSSFM